MTKRKPPYQFESEKPFQTVDLWVFYHISMQCDMNIDVNIKTGWPFIRKALWSSVKSNVSDASTIKGDQWFQVVGLNSSSTPHLFCYSVHKSMNISKHSNHWTSLVCIFDTRSPPDVCALEKYIHCMQF